MNEIVKLDRKYEKKKVCYSIKGIFQSQKV